jgi:hypothetical protein
LICPEDISSDPKRRRFMLNVIGYPLTQKRRRFMLNVIGYHLTQKEEDLCLMLLDNELKNNSFIV